MSHQDIIQTLIEWIDEHIDQPLNIDVVARKSGYSKWYLQRMFRAVMDLGYVSQQTFSRVFRREFDRTPSDYRHQISA